MNTRSFLMPALAAVLVVGAAGAARSQSNLLQVSADPFTDPNSQHATEVEPDTFAAGSTVVGTFQVGRFYDGGSDDIGFSTSHDGGAHWVSGFLPGITKAVKKSNPFDRVSDPSVAYDAAHGRWLAASLPLVNTGFGPEGRTPVVNASSDAVHWSGPVVVGGGIVGSDYMDKDWITCDTSKKSKFYGHCYVEYDDVNQGNLVLMSTSTDGGKSWSSPQTSGDSASGLGGQPLVQPNGAVIVPFFDGGSAQYAFRSTDGGATWTSTVVIAQEADHAVDGNMRTSALPSAQIDRAGNVYVVWQDCSFRSNCSANDIVMSSSSDGVNWSPKRRIPIDPRTSSFDHFIPGIAVDRATSGASAHLGVTFYFFPQANCGSSCALGEGYITSRDGGKSWHAAKVLASGIAPAWLANTNQGYMVGDYQGAAFSLGKAHGVFAVATAPASKLDEFMATNRTGLMEAAESGPTVNATLERPYLNAHSDHPRRSRTVTAQ